MDDEVRAADRLRFEEAARHQRLLSDVSRTLLDYAGPDDLEPLRRIVKLVSSELGGWCAFSLVSADGFLTPAASWHPDAAQRALGARIQAHREPRRWDAGPAERNPLLQQRALAYPAITEEMLRGGGADLQMLAALSELSLRSALSAPMFDAGKPLGTMTLLSTGPLGRIYSPDDLDFAFSLAGRAALAVRNARLVQRLGEERDRQEAARIESDRRAAELTAVFEADPNGIAIFDASHRLLLASHTLEEFFGEPIRSMVGEPFEAIYRRKLRRVMNGRQEELLERVRAIFADPSLRSLDELELDKPRHRFVRRSSVPVRGSDGSYQGRLFVYVDVTEQKELDRQRADFLTVAAHELRTPLTPLSMYLQSMERRLERAQPIEAPAVGKARRQVTRLSRLVEDLLDVSRLESRRLALERERVSLDDLVGQVVADFGHSSPQHQLVLHRNAGGLFVHVDRQRMEQVLVNLLANAIKYSPSGGEVTVTVTSSGPEVSVAVADRGIGIPLEEQPRVFERFFRAHNVTSRNYGGLGIGLFVSNEIVRAHGGRLTVQSAAGAGSTFTLTLPLDEARPGGSVRILMVDDDPTILDATSAVLREWGYEVDEARDGVSGLEALRSGRHGVMLVDLMMPMMDGGAFIGRLRSEGLAAGARLVVVSADRDVRRKAVELQADASLKKPFDLDELRAVMDRLAPLVASA